MRKRIFSALLCATLAMTSMLCVNAAETEEYKSFKVLDEEIFIANNTLVGYAYNIDEDYDTYIRYRSDEKDYIVKFNECISSLSNTKIPDTEKCAFMLFKPDLQGGYVGIGDAAKHHSFTETGGKYKKVRLKLSEFSSMFNEDGLVKNIEQSGPSYYSLKKQGDIYESVMVIRSDSALVQAVVPDENNEIEIFLSTNIGRFVECKIMYRSNDDYKGGTYFNLKTLSFGNVDGSSWVDVNDVTALQLYLAGAKELDNLGLFHADVNCDNIYDVKDVTALQLGIANL